ncbi:Hypothetical predicted protein [Paramuricea clavata]|uniref:Uncharacterized protein n=1 Tax=Paramuricea clavata TaxID=317549 RepID=A0A7D9LBT8_PARCT|nr:Hypothetical predicted protein [Paramuricea clavata]
MDNDDCTTKIIELLSDKEAYLKITDRRRKPVSKVEKDLIKLLSNIKETPSEHDPDKSQIHKHLYLHLHSTPLHSTPLMAHQQYSTGYLKSTNLRYHFASLQVALISHHTTSRNTWSKYYPHSSGGIYS